MVKQIDGLGFLELYRLERPFIVLGDQEYQFTAADTDRVSVGQEFSAHRNTVYECAIVTFQVDQLKGGIGFADGEVATRNGSIAQTKIVGGISADGKLVAGQPYEGPFRQVPKRRQLSSPSRPPSSQPA